jgi:hypothetical protein
MVIDVFANHEEIRSTCIIVICFSLGWGHTCVLVCVWGEIGME